ncbi:MAG TPA: PmeII family type II restriction endonuclease [Pyrinomonadaceae bacterium]|jgi:site-specific DNA-methyltransferase (cytosine-N4-specific)|nr:PmeII family type II restriction endonuclease [Pyrinomonadaceae bacterium]
MTSKKLYQDYHEFLTKHVVTPFYYERLMYLRCFMSLPDIISRKNPYLLKAKNIASPDELVRSIVDAFLSSQEETMFGNKLEKFAIYVSGKQYGGFKSELPSVDLEFERGDHYYIVGIKSGTRWGNSDQLNRMKENFKAARSFLRERGITKEIVAVNGCIYGKDAKPFKENYDKEKSYYKYAGQDFWNFVSGDDELYREIIKPIDEEARTRDEEFKRTYDGKVNSMVKEFSNIFLSKEGLIDWVKLVDYVSKRGKAGIVFTREKRTDECAEYLKKKKEEKERLREEKKKMEEMKKKMKSV